MVAWYRPGRMQATSMERAFYVINGEPKIRRYTEGVILCALHLLVIGVTMSSHELLSYLYMGQQKPALAWMFLLYAGNVPISPHFSIILCAH